MWRANVQDVRLGIRQHLPDWKHEVTAVRYDPAADELLLIARNGPDTAMRVLVHKYDVVWKAAAYEGPLNRFTVAAELTETRGPEN